MNAVLLGMARVFAILSLISIGGANSTLPEIRRQVVDVHGWLTNQGFADAFAISHVAPGPNIILVSLIGWKVSGIAGLLVATLAILLPSCTLAFAASRLLANWSEHRVVAVLKAGLVPLALGLLLASGVSMMRTADADAVTVGISLCTAAFVVFSTRNPLWAMGASTVVNVAVHLAR